MLTGVFKDRSAKERVASEEQALAELLSARELRQFALTRHCEIGPFAVAFLFSKQSLIVELVPTKALADDSAAARRQAARTRFFSEMGYAVLAIDPQELARRPQQVLARVLKELRS